MKRCVSYLSLTVLILTPVFASGEESPEMKMEFARRLRLRRMSELALEYLQNLKKNVPPELAAMLPLEIARTQVSLAREADPVKRARLLGQARNGLLKYIAANRGKPEIVQIKAETARVTYYEAQALLTQSYKQEDPEGRRAFLLKAKSTFEAAKKEFDASIKELAAAVAKYQKPANAKQKLLKSQLTSELLRLQFDKAKLYLDQAVTYENLGSAAARLERDKIVKAAGEILEKVALEAEKKSAPDVSFKAIAWLMRVHVERQFPDKAVNLYNNLMQFGTPSGLRTIDQKIDFLRKFPYRTLVGLRKVLSPEAAPGLRWSTYFYIQVLHKHPSPPIPKGYTKDQYIRLLCLSWLKVFPGYERTAEGHGIRFELAESDLKLAYAISKTPATDARAKPLFGEALDIYKDISGSDSDLANVSSRKFFSLQILRIGKDRPASQLTNFEDCVVKARYEMILMIKTANQLASENVKAKKDKLEKVKKQHLEATIGAFQRALRLARANTSPHEIDTARYFLAYMYLLNDDPYRSAILSEYLARREPPAKHGHLAAGYALQAYKKVIDRHNLLPNRNRLRDLAEFVMNRRAKDWQGQPVVPVAKYQLAMVYLREKDFDKTIEILGTLQPDFKAYTFAKCQLALTALNARKSALDKNNQKAAEKYRNAALRAMESVAKLPEDTDDATAAMFFSTQIEHGKLLYEDAASFIKQGKRNVANAKYREMAALTNSLRAQYGKAKLESLNAEMKKGLGDALNALAMYARLGVGEMAYRDSKYDEVIGPNVAGEIVDTVGALGTKGGKIRMRDYRVAGELLGLAMRAHVQKGNVKKAEALLSLMQRLEGPTGEIPDPTLPLRKLIADLQSQVKELEQKKKNAELKKMAQKFTAFFDALLNSKGVGKLDRNTLFFMGRSYSILNAHNRASEVYARIQKPPAFDAKKPLTAREKTASAQLSAQAKALFEQQIGKAVGPKLSTDEQTKWAVVQQKVKDDFAKWRKGNDDKKMQLWWLIQVYRAKELRKGKQLDEAEKLLDMNLQAEKAAGKILAQKEKVHILEDRGLYGRAISAWSRYMQNPSLKARLRTDQRMKEIYFESYYHFVWNWYMYSQTGGKKSEEKYLNRAADYILRLESAKNKEGWNMIESKVRDLLDDAPRLNRVYTQLKKERQGKG